MLAEHEMFEKFGGGEASGQIDERCWSNITLQLIIQCCRWWPNCPTCGVQQCVIMCVLNNVEGVCQPDIHLLNNNKSNIYCLFFLSFSFGRIAPLLAHSLHKREVPVSSPGHGT